MKLLSSSFRNAFIFFVFGATSLTWSCSSTCTEVCEAVVECVDGEISRGCSLGDAPEKVIEQCVSACDKALEKTDARDIESVEACLECEAQEGDDACTMDAIEDCDCDDRDVEEFAEEFAEDFGVDFTCDTGEKGNWTFGNLFRYF